MPDVAGNAPDIPNAHLLQMGQREMPREELEEREAAMDACEGDWRAHFLEIYETGGWRSVRGRPYRTFVDYAEQRWHKPRTTAYLLIGAALLERMKRREFPGSGKKVPLTHVEAIQDLEEEERELVYGVVLDRHGPKPTVDQVLEVREELFDPKPTAPSRTRPAAEEDPADLLAAAEKLGEKLRVKLTKAGDGDLVRQAEALLEAIRAKLAA